MSTIRLSTDTLHPQSRDLFWYISYDIWNTILGQQFSMIVQSQSLLNLSKEHGNKEHWCSTGFTTSLWNRKSIVYVHIFHVLTLHWKNQTLKSTLIHAFLTSTVDNCLLSGNYNYLLKILQIVHTCVARLTLSKEKYAYADVTPMLVELHLLKVMTE